MAAALVSLFAVGSPWSERPEGESFAAWAQHAFGEVPAVAGEPPNAPTEEQQWEFATSISSRAGGNALLKPLSALAPEVQWVATGKPTGQVKISLRNIACPAAWDRQVVVGRKAWSAWLLLPLSAPLRTAQAPEGRAVPPAPRPAWGRLRDMGR